MGSNGVRGAWIGGGRRGISVLWLLVSLSAAAWIVWSSRSDITLLAGTSLWVLALMIVLHAVSLITQSERFRIILEHHSEADFGIAVWMRLFVRGRLFSFMIPQSGHVYRGVALRQSHETPALRYVSSLATQTWMALVASLGFATLLGLLTVRLDGGARLGGPLTALPISALCVGFAPYLLTRLYRFIPSRLRQTRVVRRARQAWLLARRTARSKRLVFEFLAYVLLGLASGALGMKIAFGVTGQEVTWTAAVVILAFVHLGNVISFTPGNLGIQELGVAALAVFLGYPPAAGVVASLVVRLSNIIALTILALLLELEVFVRRSPSAH